MNTGQMLITIAALMLLTLVILRVNNNFLSTNTILMENKFGVLAVSLATSILEEAKGKAFDHNTDTNTVTSSNQLSTIGPESGEVYPNFNDFDDFNGFSKIDSTLPSAPFKIECEVHYINPSNPNLTTGSKTWHKRMNVTVSSDFMQDTIRLTSIYSYFFFR
ncbi:MAG: hypothetical protein QY331_14830 [Melioribacteraceae bacterium]|nr:hypothetical protein [Melioribacteraceae bacterium]RJP58508.1 MAG: hypothetical protein C4543_08200 [Ignavibacteriales bacterium]WKZ69234.1 MAG: hypothetical protein QY331_14830 [Melioribacteraceae bacterium]